MSSGNEHDFQINRGTFSNSGTGYGTFRGSYPSFGHLHWICRSSWPHGMHLHSSCNMGNRPLYQDPHLDLWNIADSRYHGSILGFPGFGGSILWHTHSKR